LMRLNTLSMGMAQCKVLGSWLSHNPNLPRISLCGNALTDAMFVLIANGLATNETIFGLDVSDNRIGDEGVAALSAKVLANPHTNLMRLTLNANYIGKEGAQCLAEALSVNWTLMELNISNQLNGLGDEAVNLLCGGLEANESLQTLRLGQNGLSSECCFGLGRLLKVHPNLDKLEVYNNKLIAGSGFVTLCEGLSANSRLRTLALAETSPGKDGARALLKTVMKQFVHTKRMIEETTRGVRECAAIKECVSENDVETFSDDLIHEIVTVYVGYASLKHLDLKNCYIQNTAAGVDSLVQLKSDLEKRGHKLNISW